MFQRHVGGFNREITDGITRCLRLENLRFQNAIGQIGADLVDGIFYLVDRVVNVVTNFKLDDNLGTALVCSGIDLLDAVDIAHRRFDLLRNLADDFAWCRARLRDDDDDDGKFNVGIILNFHTHEADDAGQR